MTNCQLKMTNELRNVTGEEHVLPSASVID